MYVCPAAGRDDRRELTRLRTGRRVEQGGTVNPSAVSVPQYRALGFWPAEDLALGF